MRPLAHRQLPQGYRILLRLDLVHNRRQLKTVTALSLVLAAVTVAAGFAAGQGMMPFAEQTNVGMLLLKAAAVLAGAVVYIVGHEAVHGVLMWLFSRQKPHFGATLMYAYAGSDAYFAKAPYLCISAAPLLVWGVGLTALALWAPADWFWAVWALQALNVSGAAGDVYVCARMARMPKDVLVHDNGTAMTAFAHTQAVHQAKMG